MQGLIVARLANLRDSLLRLVPFNNKESSLPSKRGRHSARDSEEEYALGYKHGRRGEPCRPSSSAYLDGYREGREVAQIAEENRANSQLLRRAAG